MSQRSITADPSTAPEWLRRGQELEAQHTPESLAAAVAAYEQAVDRLRTPANAHALGIAHMNRGNALQKLSRWDEAVAAYDCAIACLTPLAAANPSAANSVGAAWMNRGHARLLQGGTPALADALHSQDEAIARLQTLSLEQHPAHRLNFAGAWINRAQTLLASPSPVAVAAQGDATSALELLRPVELSQPPAGQLSLQAHHILCNALALRLRMGPSAELISDTGDAIDSAMSLARHWEQQHPGAFRPLVVALYRFGAEFYFAHQPQFLAEFLLETLDPANTAGAIPNDPALHHIAGHALARAQADTYNRLLAAPAGEHAARLQQVAADLAAAEARRATLVAATSPARLPVPEPVA